MDRVQLQKYEMEHASTPLLTITWDIATDLKEPSLSWKCYSDQRFQVIKPIHCNIHEIVFRNPNPNTRNLYQLREKTGKSIKVAQRDILRNSIKNARDLGGYKTIQGKSIKWGMLYRSGELTDLTTDEAEFYDSMKLRTLCDLRSGSEIAVLNQQLISGKRYLNLPLMDTIFFHHELLYDKENIRSYCKQSYRDFSLHRSVAKFFTVLTQENNFPLLVYCTGGKDRTGVLCALLLTALGVPHDTIMEDYLLSGPYVDQILERFDKNEIKKLDPSVTRNNLQEFLYPNMEYLNAVFEGITQQFGNIDLYFDSMGFTLNKRNKLKHMMLE